MLELNKQAHTVLTIEMLHNLILLLKCIYEPFGKYFKSTNANIFFTENCPNNFFNHLQLDLLFNSTHENGWHVESYLIC